MLLFRREKDSFEREHMKKWGPDRRRLDKSVDDELENGKGEKKKKKKKKTAKKYEKQGWSEIGIL